METSVKNGELNLALQVALQTMKERCVTVQKRLAIVEKENLELKERIENKQQINVTAPVGSNGGAAELFQLRLQVSEMQRQKAQMTDHINMVSEENRKLWARLSQVAKEHDNFLGSIKNSDEGFRMSSTQSAEDLIKERGAAARASLTQQNLIRSKTFTQHSPNPNLRHKVLEENTSAKAHIEETEESLKQANTDDESDIDMEVKKCFDDMQELNREAKHQHFQLITALNMLENKKVTSQCTECVKRSQKPEMADKSLETDDSLSELQQIENNKVKLDLVHTVNDSQTRMNIIQNKIQADAMDKTCPMCGRVFNSFVPFETFRQHVEQHFIDDSSSSSSNGNDGETSIDRNFEFVSHTVGDF